VEGCEPFEFPVPNEELAPFPPDWSPPPDGLELSPELDPPAADPPWAAPPEAAPPELSWPGALAAAQSEPAITMAVQSRSEIMESSFGLEK
jgi:hypothetical protein